MFNWISKWIVSCHSKSEWKSVRFCKINGSACANWHLTNHWWMMCWALLSEFMKNIIIWTRIWFLFASIMMMWQIWLKTKYLFIDFSKCAFTAHTTRVDTLLVISFPYNHWPVLFDESNRILGWKPICLHHFVDEWHEEGGFSIISPANSNAGKHFY